MNVLRSGMECSEEPNDLKPEIMGCLGLAPGGYKYTPTETGGYRATRGWKQVQRKHVWVSEQILSKRVTVREHYFS